MTEPASGGIVLRGVAASEGLALGPLRIAAPSEFEPDSAPRFDSEEEDSRLASAVRDVRADLEKIRDETAERHDAWTAEILESHLFFLEDPEFTAGTEELTAAGHSAEFAVCRVRDAIASMLEDSGDDLIAQRGTDIRDIYGRIVRSLRGVEETESPESRSPAILAAEDLLPLDALRMDPREVLAVVTEKGGPNGHGAIVARSLGIPAVVSVPGLLAAAREGAEAVVDGASGRIEIDPPEPRRREAARLIAEAEERRNELLRFRDKAGRSLDGKPLAIYAHAGPGGDISGALENGAEGIGLFRTEFLFMERTAPPDEEAQYRVYRRILEQADGRPVIFRTMDLGGDKAVPYLEFPDEDNPFLGLRGIRYALARPDLFTVQLRALLRAGHGHDLRLMFPMIAAPEEWDRAKALVEEASSALRDEGRECSERPRIGMMVEVPSAALEADAFARRADFFSIGTNDLIQYVQAADRGNSRVSALYRPSAPAVLKLIDRTVRGGHRGGIPVSLCGEMGGDGTFLPLLLGLDLDGLSMPAPAVPAAKERLSRLNAESCRSLARRCLECDTAEEVEDLLREAG